MSEHDYWQVESSVYGGVGYAPATLEEYAAIAKALDDEAAGFAAIATAWESAALQLQSHRHSAPMCVTLQSGDPSAVVPGHVTAPYAALGNRCYDHATACQRLSDDLRGAADLLIRAHSLYSQAEMTARRMFTELLQAGTQAKPGYAAAGVAAVAAGGFLAVVCDDAFQTLTDACLNDRFPSDQRATLISVSSMCFSLVMIALSPLAGAAAGFVF